MTRVHIDIISVVSIYLTVACVCGADGVTKPEPPSPESMGILSREESRLPIPDHWNNAKLQDALATGLKRLADEKLPGHVFTQEKNDPNGTMRIAWKTQAYDVPRPTGKQQHAPVVVRRETGPAAEGLILTVWLSDTLGAADRPYTRDNAGIWKTYCGQASVPSLKKHLLFNVDYGPRTDEGLVDVFCSPRMWIKAAEVADKAVPTGGDRPPPTMEEDDR